MHSVKNLQKIPSHLFSLILACSILVSLCACSSQVLPMNDEPSSIPESSQEQSSDESSIIPDDSRRESPNVEQDNKIENPDFRNVQWGMSKNEVKEHEELALDELSADSNALYAETKVQGLPMILCYYFNSRDELYSAYYALSEDYTSDNLYIHAYDTLLEALTEKYGDPTSEEDIWINDLFRDSPNDYGFAVSLGDYVRKSTWDKPGTSILLLLGGGNYDISLGIKYSSENFTEDKDSGSGL